MAKLKSSYTPSIAFNSRMNHPWCGRIDGELGNEVEFYADTPKQLMDKFHEFADERIKDWQNFDKVVDHAASKLRGKSK